MVRDLYFAYVKTRKSDVYLMRKLSVISASEFMEFIGDGFGQEFQYRGAHFFRCVAGIVESPTVDLPKAARSG